MARAAHIPPSAGIPARWWAENAGLVFDLSSYAVFAAATFIAVATFRDYGITWDESWHHTYGNYILEWFRTGFRDRSALSYRADYLYGGAYDALAALFARVVPLPWFEAVHLFGALVGVLGLVAVWRLGRVLAGPAAGFAATALLAATSVYHGHTFNNPKDVPFAVGYTFAIAELVEVVRAFPVVSRGRWVRLGLACGAAMSVRIGGMLVLCYLLAAVVGFAAWVFATTRNQDLAERVFVRLFRGFLGVWALGWAVMLVFWPWAQLDPVRRPFFALGRMTRFNLHTRKMPFGDAEIATYAVPWDYLPRYFLFKLPEVLLVFAAVGAVLGVRAMVRRWKARRGGADLVAAACVLLAIAFPPVWAVVVRSNLYDGLRHFLFLVPMLAGVGGVAAVALARRLRAAAQVPPAALAAVFVAWCGREVVVMAGLHPHEYVYFNRIAGGLPGVLERYDTDYYGNGYREAFDRLRDELWRTDREGVLSRRYLVGGCIPRFVAEEYLRSVLVWRERNDKRPLDFFLGYQRNKCFQRHRHRPIFTQVERQGAPIVLVRDMRRVRQKAPGERKDAGSDRPAPRPSIRPAPRTPERGKGPSQPAGPVSGRPKAGAGRAPRGAGRAGAGEGAVGVSPRP